MIHCGFLQMPTLSFRPSTRSIRVDHFSGSFADDDDLVLMNSLKQRGPILMMKGYFSSMHRNPMYTTAISLGLVAP